MSRVEVFAHRGSSLDHPENTLAAFRAAIEEGATGIETDLRLSRDGAIVLVHDRDLRRVAGDPRRVADLDVAELRELDVGRGERVPTLEELWELAARRVRLNLEVKDPRVAPRLIDFLSRRRTPVVVTSASWRVLDRVRASLPHLPTGPVLNRLGPEERGRLAGRGCRVVSLAERACSAEGAAFCRQAGLELVLWVVNRPERVIHWADRGVAGVFTDCPRTIVAALRGR